MSSWRRRENSLWRSNQLLCFVIVLRIPNLVAPLKSPILRKSWELPKCQVVIFLRIYRFPSALTWRLLFEALLLSNKVHSKWIASRMYSFRNFWNKLPFLLFLSIHPCLHLLTTSTTLRWFKHMNLSHPSPFYQWMSLFRAPKSRHYPSWFALSRRTILQRGTLKSSARALLNTEWAFSTRWQDPSSRTHVRAHFQCLGCKVTWTLHHGVPYLFSFGINSRPLCLINSPFPA